jgi:hypothetical protein
MEKNKCFSGVCGANSQVKRHSLLTGIVAAALASALAVTACGGKAAQSSSGGGNVAAGAAKEAAQEVKGAVSGGGQPAAATDFIYHLNDAGDGVVITGIQEDAKFGAHMVVPAEIEGYPVVAFLVQYTDIVVKRMKRPPLESVVFPDSIIFLGYSEIKVDKGGGWYPLEGEYEELAPLKEYLIRDFTTFSGSKSLKRVVFPKNLKIIPLRFASGCPSLMPEGIVWPEALEVIGMGAFAGNSFTELRIPEGVKFIDGTLGGAFARSKTLKSVTIPDSIEQIGVQTFSDCPELTTVKIPAHPIKYLSRPNSSFSGCPKLSLASQVAIMDTGYPDKAF